MQILAQGFPCSTFLLPESSARTWPTAFFTAMEGMGDKLQRLKGEQQQLKRQEAEVKAQLKKARVQGDREKRGWQLTVFMSHVVLIAYALCDYQAPAAIQFLVGTGRKRRWPEKSEAELQDLVECLFLECDTEDFTNLADKANPKDPEAFKVAAQHTEEWKLAVHVADQNVRLGIAPSTESLLNLWKHRRAAYHEASRPSDPGSVAEDKARQWARRWRLRQGAKHGAVRVRDELTVGETRSKAGPLPGKPKTRPK